MIILKHDGADIGFCRIQYLGPNGTQYCLQDEGNGAFIFYRCAGDYEPNYSVNPAAFSIARHESALDGDIEFLEAAGCFLFHDAIEALKGMMAIRGTWQKDLPGAEISKWPEMAEKIIAQAEDLI